MTVHVFRPGGSSGFIIRQTGINSITVIDMGTQPGQSFVGELEKNQFSINDISVLALTHLHGDHINAEGIRLLIKSANCSIIIPRLCWEHRPAGDELLTRAYQELAGYNKLILIEGQSSLRVGKTLVFWTPITHSIDEKVIFGGNMAYRINGVIISGDGPVRDLFSCNNNAFLMSNDDSPIKILAINLAHLDTNDLNTQDFFDEARKERYRNEHGMAGELLDAISNPRYRDFFASLEKLIPTHIRRHPLVESRALFKSLIEKSRDKNGFHFTVSYE